MLPTKNSALHKHDSKLIQNPYINFLYNLINYIILIIIQIIKYNIIYFILKKPYFLY